MMDRWENFWKSGRVEDYLGYCKEESNCLNGNWVQETSSVGGSINDGHLQCGQKAENGKMDEKFPY